MAEALKAKCRGEACLARPRSGIRTAHSVQGTIVSAALPDLSLRGPKGAVAISCDRSRFRRKFPVIRHCTVRLPRRFAPRNDTSGECGGAPAPSSGLMTPYKALTNCRYTPYFGAYRLTTADTSRRCFPEIAPQGHFLALRAQGATSACGLLAMTSLPPCISTLPPTTFHTFHHIPLSKCFT